MIFKYILFFDIFEGSKIPDKVIHKLFSSLKNNINIYNNYIEENIFTILKRKYDEQNNLLSSTAYLIVEFKKELRTKYFTEDATLKLGFKQKDIINESIDLLMPRDFCKSHKNAIKHLIIANQIKFRNSKQSYYFDKTNSVLYSANFEGSLIYNLSKSLLMMFESNFNFENEYRFMLNNNFELLASSMNFEDEYHLNQRILQAYNIKFLDIVKVKPEKLTKKFEKEFKKIQYEKLIRQVKTQEYFIPQFYVPSKDKIFSMVNQKYFNNSKSNLLSKISKFNDKVENYEHMDNHKDNNNDDEEKELIQNENFKNSISEIFVNHGEVVLHKNYNINLNKGTFY